MDNEIETRLSEIEARMRSLETVAADPWASTPTALDPPGPRPAMEGPHLFPDEDEGFWGETVSDLTGGAYTFKEKVLTDGTTWADLTGGRTGTCYEANDVAGIADGTIIKIREEYDTGGDLRYVFNHEVEPKGDLDTGTSDSTFDSDSSGKGNLVTEVVDGQTLVVRLRQTKCWIRTDQWGCSDCGVRGFAVNRWGDIVAFQLLSPFKGWYDLDGNAIGAPSAGLSPNPGIWVAETWYQNGSVIAEGPGTFTAQGLGQTGAVEPDWNVGVGEEIVDGGMTWKRTT